MKRFVLLLFVLALLTGCEKEDASIRFIRWTPHGIVFVRLGALFRWSADADRRSSQIGDWRLKEERFTLAPGGGSIAVVPDREKVWDVWEVDLLSGAGSKITDSVYKDYFPVYHPSGTDVYFISYRGGRPDIWRVRLENLSAVRVTDDDREERQLAISPDGTTLLYATADDGGVSLYTLEIGGGREKKVAAGLSDVSFLRFSPHGDHYTFCSGGGLWMGEIEGEASRIGDADFAAWGPRGKTISYCTDGDIWQRSLGAFPRQRRLTRNVGVDAVPAPAPDGKRLAYSTGPGKKPELLTVVSSSFWGKSRIWCPGDAELVEEYYCANGRPKEAARYLASIIDESRDKEKIARLLAGSYLKAGQYRRAVAVLRNYTQDSYEIGKIYMYYLRDFSRALRYFKGLEKAKEELMLIYACRPPLLRAYCRGWVDIQQGKYERGVWEIDKFIERSGRLKALEGIYYMRAEVYDRDLHDAEQAIRAYAAVLDAWPDGDRAIRARARLAELYEAAGEFPEALEAYRSVVASAGDDLASEKARAYVGILRLTLEGAGDLQPLLREISADQGPYRGEFVDDALRLLDEKGEHGEANGLIRLALFDWNLDLEDLSEGLYRSLSSVDADTLVQVKLAELPSWLKERAVIVASRVDPKLAAPVGELLKGPHVAEAREIVGEIKALLSARDFDEADLSSLDIFGDYLLGNLSLTEGDVSGAVSHFKKLCRENLRSYYHQLSCCLDADREEAEEWLKLERKYTFAFWELALEFVDIISGRSSLFSAGDDLDRASGFAGEYGAFISRHPGSPLVPASAARVAYALPDPGKRKALLKILADHEGGCISMPFALLVGDYISTGNYGLAIAVGEPLARSVDDPSIKLAVADLLSDVGGEQDAKAFLWDISINYTESPEWEVAQDRLVSDLASSGKYKSALLMLDELIERRPTSEPVLSGEAALMRIEFMVKLGRLAEAAEAAEAMILGESPSLHQLPDRMNDNLARYMSKEKKNALARLHSIVGDDEKARLEEMVPELRDKKQETNNNQ